MTDRLPGSPGKYSAVVAGEELRKMQAGKPFAMQLQLDDDPVREGTPYSKAAVLPDSLAEKICPGIEDPMPKDALECLWEKKADGICHKTGAAIALNDSAHTPLKGLKLFGKTTQDGTPTPDTPVELESAGANGSIGVTVAGKNLLNYEIIGDSSGSATPYTIDENGYITLNNVSSNKHWPMQIITGLKGKFYSTIEIVSLTTGVNIYVGNSSTDHSSVMTQAGTKTYTKEVDGSFYFIVYMPAESSVKFRAIVSADSNTDYEPYKELQTLTASTPNGLPGIPVSSGGNYTDENGQQWICDEIDFARGVYVQRIAEICLDGSVAPNQYTQTGEGMRFGWTGNAGFTPKDYTRSDFAMCNSFKPSVSPIWNNALNGGICAHTKGNIYLRYDAVTSPEAMAEYLTNNPVVYHYVIEKPVEADLSAEELEAYAKLHTNKPNTTVLNDAGAGMEIVYYTPATAVQMVHSPADAGKVLSIDEHGCVALTKQEDRVVEQGVFGDWTYRKWDSGTAECWLTHVDTADTGNTFGGSVVWDKFYLSHTSDISLPVVFTETPTFHVSVSGGAPVIYSGTSYVSNAVVNMIQLMSYVRTEDTSKSYNITYCVHAIGKWK